jgi:hypothetical protein
VEATTSDKTHKSITKSKTWKMESASKPKSALITILRYIIS